MKEIRIIIFPLLLFAKLPLGQYFQNLNFDNIIFLIFIILSLDYFKEYLRVGSAINTFGSSLIPNEEFNIHEIIQKIRKYKTYKDLSENRLVIYRIDRYMKKLVNDGYLTENRGTFKKKTEF